jgi:hypothetical protein
VSINEAVAFALTGEMLQPPADLSAQCAEEFAAWLADAGWDAARLRDLRDATVQAGTKWPLPLTIEERGGVGAAQWSAIVRGVIEAAKLDQPSRPVNPSGPPDAEDLRLLAEVPPHHVHGV